MENNFDYSRFMGLFYHYENLSSYTGEERNAMQNIIPMTKEIFEKCIKTALSIYDFENVRYLTRSYPEFTKKSELLKNKNAYYIVK